MLCLVNSLRLFSVSMLLLLCYCYIYYHVYNHLVNGLRRLTQKALYRTTQIQYALYLVLAGSWYQVFLMYVPLISIAIVQLPLRSLIASLFRNERHHSVATVLSGPVTTVLRWQNTID